MSQSKGKKTYKIIFLGESSVGKTCMIERFVNDIFEDYFNPTIGVDFLSKDIKYKGRSCRFQLWDTAGQQKFKSLIPNYLKDAVGCVFVFDVNKPSTLINLEQWITIFREHARERAITIICGNKNDLDKSFDKEQLERLIEKYKMPYYGVSAKTGNGIEDIFTRIAEMIEKQQQEKIRKLKLTYSEEYEHPPVTTESLTRSQTQSNTESEKSPKQGAKVDLKGKEGVRRKCC